MIEDLDRPVIAAVNGFALGGGTEIGPCLRFYLRFRECEVWSSRSDPRILPGFGGTQRLSRLIGKGKAKELIMTGKIIGAQEAYQLGIVNQVLPSGFSDGGDEKIGCSDRSQWSHWTEIGQDGGRCGFQYGLGRSLFLGILCLQPRFHHRGSEGRNDGFPREAKAEF